MQTGGSSSESTRANSLSPGVQPADAESTIVGAIRELLERRDAVPVDLTFDSNLYDDLDLDSLELAELSAVLEDDLGRDPYSAGLVPRTVGEVVEFYR